MRRFVLVLSSLAACWPSLALAQQAANQPSDLSTMSIEALMDLPVTSVSRKSEPLSRAAAAIYVITQEDIRRSGATSLPEVLRMVPGLDVAQMDASTWAISARGFNTQYAFYMLVLVDGRTVYDPSFNGVYWSAQDTLLEDVERIEVICGPGAALWGQNAVNGVINITTKRASESQGALVTALAGNQETPQVAVRYGGKAGSVGSYRIFGKYFDRQEQDLPSGLPAPDGWHNLRMGFRSDWDLTDDDSLTVSGGGYHGLERHRVNTIASLAPPVQQEIVNRVHVAGSDIELKWHRKISDRSAFDVNAYYDYSDRRDHASAAIRHTGNLDFQHHFAAGSRHDLLWGGGWQRTSHTTNGGFLVSFDPRAEIDTIVNLFVQDEVTLWPNRLSVVVGARLTRDRSREPEIQPDARLLWTPHPKHSLWAAVSRAIGEPSFSSRAVRFSLSVMSGPGGVPIVPTVLGNPDLDDSDAFSVQAGYRGQLGRTLTVSAAGFYTRYDHVQGSAPGEPYLELSPAPAHLILPIPFQNGLRGDTQGMEIDGTWQVNSRWRVSASHSLLFMSLHDIVPGAGVTGAAVPGANPRNQVVVKSLLNLPRNWEWDVLAYYVGGLPADNIPSYVRMDSRIGWQPGEHLAISVAGQNLLQPRHAEFGGGTANILPTQIRRSAYVKVTWRF